MIQSWAKLLPYGLLIWLVRKSSNEDGQGHITFGSNEYPVSYYQLGAGEFVVYSQEHQDLYNERRESKRESKRTKKLDKVNAQLRDDYWLKKDLREQFEQETENEKLGW